MQNILWIVLIGILAVSLQAMLFGNRGLKKIYYHRSFKKKSLFAGETTEMVEIMENHKLLPVPWLRVECRMPDSMVFQAQQNMLAEDARYHRSLFFLSPYFRLVRRHSVVCQKRGVYHISTVSMTCGDLFGLKVRTQERAIDLCITVYPRLLSPDALEMPSSRWQGELMVKRWIAPDPFLYCGMRDYQRGDAQRDIHWRATARMGKLQVMQRDFTACPRLMVLINVQIAQDQWNMLDDRQAQRIEQVISVGATAAIYALDHGVEAGLGSNAQTTDGDHQCLLIPPATSSQQRELVLDALANITTLRQMNFHTYLDQLPTMSEMDFLIVTPYVTPMLEQRAALLRMRGNSVLFLPVFEGGEDHAMDA